jgi:hypothetical protein
MKYVFSNSRHPIVTVNTVNTVGISFPDLQPELRLRCRKKPPKTLDLKHRPANKTVHEVLTL